MSCICQYFVHSQQQHEPDDTTIMKKDGTTKAEAEAEPEIETETTDASVEPSTQSDISATELSAVRAENWLLNKNLAEARITIENLEDLVKTIMDKQNVMLAEMYHVKRLNQDLEEECRLQRDYHAMERHAMIRELQDAKELLQKRSKLLEETSQKNDELIGEVQDANEKIYIMGMKYLRLKNERSYHSSESSDSKVSSDEDQSE